MGKRSSVLDANRVSIEALRPYEYVGLSAVDHGWASMFERNCLQIWSYGGRLALDLVFGGVMKFCSRGTTGDLPNVVIPLLVQSRGLVVAWSSGVCAAGA